LNRGGWYLTWVDGAMIREKGFFNLSLSWGGGWFVVNLPRDRSVLSAGETCYLKAEQFDQAPENNSKKMLMKPKGGSLFFEIFDNSYYGGKE